MSIRHISRRCWPTVVMIVLVLQAAAVRAEALTPGQAQSGSLLFRMQEGYRTATALDTAVDMRISGGVARVAVRQRFENTGTDWAEGLYVFPLPETAAVDRMRLTIGERVIEGEIQEREEARNTYEQARAAGQRTSLVEQERPNLFTTSVANIAPGESLTVEIEYLEELRFADGHFSLRFPLTLTPRYLPGQALPDREGSGWSPDTSEVPDASRISPPVVTTSTRHRVTMSITLDAGLPLDLIASRYHPVTVTESHGRYDVALADASVPMDHDFELVWQPATGHAPQATVFTETIDGVAHYLLMVMPPSAVSETAAAMAREMIFIVDTSGSMHGTSMTQGRAALLRALDGLEAQDRFNIIEFDSAVRSLFPASVDVSSATLEEARDFVRALAADGGTEMRPALELALRDAPAESHLRQIVFITDGAVGNEDELFRLISERLGAGRLFTIGIGSAPNSWFMRKAAEVGRGTFTMVSALNEVEEKLERLFRKIGQPQVTDIRVEWPAGVTVETYPAVVPDLYVDEPVSVRAKMTGSLAQTGTVHISGNSIGGAWRRELSLAGGLPNAGAEGVAALWARARIADLTDQARRGRDDETVKRDIIDTALAHRLVSKYTSLVAVDKTPARAADERLAAEALANRLPYGQSAEAIFGFPATATDAARLQAVGAMLLLAGLLLILLGRRPENARVAAR